MVSSSPPRSPSLGWCSRVLTAPTPASCWPPPSWHRPHPPHRHPNTELLFIQSGTLEYLDDGKVIAVEANDVVFSASNVSHGLKNVGATPASYIVCSISKQLAE